MMKNLVGIIMSTIIILGLFSPYIYADEPSSWAKEDIEVINQLGAYTDALSGGYTDPITRLEFTELMVLSYKAMVGNVNLTATIDNPFLDTENEAVVLAYELNLINGTSDTTFSPNATLNREQMMSIYVRMILLIQEELSLEVLDLTRHAVTFEDRYEVSNWAFDAMIIASINGLIQGNDSGYLMPKLESTKEQALVINYRIIRMVEESDGYGEVAVTTISEEQGMVTCDVLNFRSSPDTSSKENIITQLYQYEVVTLLRQEGDWYYIKAMSGQEGYVHGDYIRLYDTYVESTELRSSIVSTAKEYIGLPYIYGGTSLTSGVDCSGFTQAIYSLHGIFLRRTATQQSKQALTIASKDLMVGDLVTYGYNGVISHIAIYVGNGQIIHATSSRGVMVTDMYDYLNLPIVGYHRVIMD